MASLGRVLIRNLKDICAVYRSGSTNILDRLVFTTPLVPRVWEAISRTVHDVCRVAFGPVLTLVCTFLQGVISRIVQDPSCPERSIVTAFCTFYSRLLQVQDDHDIYELQQPFSLAELVRPHKHTSCARRAVC